MYTSLLWTSKEYRSSENCIVRTGHAGVEIHSIIVGCTGNRPFKAEYIIKTNADWETCYCQLSVEINGDSHSVLLQKETEGWLLDGKLRPEFDGCTDVDIPITPFTNTLPINRCKLQLDESRVIKVIYLDMLNDSITAVQQQYTRLPGSMYRYENVPNDFEAAITVDDAGLVTDYPGLFERVAVSQWS